MPTGINAIFYQFSKRRNSTARPDGNGVFSAMCLLKEGTSILNPALQIAGNLIARPLANYAYIAHFSRYYYIRDWVFIDGLWEVYMEVDVLATYRTEIGNSTAYVARASEDYDGTIIDGMFPTTALCSMSRVGWTGGSPWVSSYGQGTYIVGIVNSEASGVGGITYYAMSNSSFNDFKSYLLGDYDWTGIEDSNPDLGENLYKSLFNPFQYVVSINWFPISYSSISGTAATVKLGWWVLSANIGAKVLSVGKYTLEANIYAPSHPDAASRGKYLNGAPFSDYRLFAPPFGEFTLDAKMLASANAQYDGGYFSPIFCHITVDLITGMGELTCAISASPGAGTLVQASAMVGVPIAIAQINSNGWGQVRNIAETSASVLSSAISLNFGGVISSATTGILNGIELSIPHSQEKGSNGSIAPYGRGFYVDCIYNGLTDDAVSDKGRPLCKEVVLSTLAGGYVQTVGAHVDIAGFADEINQINDMLDAGIYLILPAG